MMELPESYTLARQVTKALKGKVINRVEAGHSPHKFAFFKGDVPHYEKMLIGQEIVEGKNQGGLLEIDTKDCMLFFGDGAKPQYYESGQPEPKKHQFLIGFEDASFLAVSIQMYGEIGVYPIGACDDGYYISSSTKTGPLEEAFTYDYFKGLYQETDKKMTIKGFLATQQRIPGLGNGVLQDILWQAGLDPRYDMKVMQEEDFKRVYEAVRKLLNKMCQAGGRNVEKDLFGNSGGYVTQLSKLSLDKPCPKCGQSIQKANYMGGTIYFCSHCQKR